MTRFWTVTIPHDPLPQPGDPVEVIRAGSGHAYVAWSRGRSMPIEAVTDYGDQGRRAVKPRETCGTIGLISLIEDRLAVMRID